uniref:Ommochrome-binding protein-like n=1 Tax=Pectinophora gossypiella TaxID=13191 RepID=A0A1E1WDT9_PECGO
MMQLLILSVVLAVARARVIEDCSGVVVHNTKHEAQVLKTGIDSPYQLALDYDTNYLFFSYSSPEDMDDGFKSAYINLKTNEFGVIHGISGGFANAVDRKNHIVYLGGNDGIYKFDFGTKNATFEGARDVSIWQLFFKDKLYFTNYPDEHVFTYEQGEPKLLPALKNTKTMLFALDSNDNIVVSNSSGIFYYVKDLSKSYHLGDYVANGITTDINKKVYFSTPDSLFFIDESGPSVVKLADIDDSIYGLVVDTDNSFIYADGNSIIRLKPTKTRCYSDNEIKD